jgi:uncharacterized protein with von Willebrand factor type A (vWA) domain
MSKVVVLSQNYKLSVVEGVGVIDEVRRYRGSRILDIVSKILGQSAPEIMTPELAVDIFYSFLLPVPDVVRSLEKGGVDEETSFRLQIISALLASPNLWPVKPYTIADSVTSLVASASFIEKLARLLQRRGGGQGEGRKGPEQSEAQDLDEKRISEMVSKALEQVDKDVKVAKDVKRILTGLGAGKGSVLAFDESMEEVLRLARETDITKVLEKIGGLKLPAVRATYERFNRGWMDGLEIGGDLERLHYSQLALPLIYFLASMADSKLLLYRKVTPVSKGPIYVLMDKSGSMVGTKIDWARAVAVALLKRAVSEGRDFYARFFDSIAYPSVQVKPNAKVSDTVRALSYIARVKAGGGTDIARAIMTACEDIQGGRRRLSDIILISDGEDRISPELLSKVLKVANARLHTIMVQGHNVYLKQISYRYMTVKKLEAKEVIKVVDFT